MSSRRQQEKKACHWWALEAMETYATDYQDDIISAEIVEDKYVRVRWDDGVEVLFKVKVHVEECPEKYGD